MMRFYVALSKSTHHGKGNPQAAAHGGRRNMHPGHHITVHISQIKQLKNPITFTSCTIDPVVFGKIALNFFA